MSQDPPSAPSVLVVLIARNGEPWLRDCLAGLAAQEYPRLGVIGVDAGSRDGSRELLVQALGEARVVAAEPTLEGVISAVSAREGTAEADFLLLLHDDVVLGEDAILRMVEAAATMEPAGIVGPKIVDWSDPRVLLDIGWSADRFGQSYSPLEPDERDQGQHDRLREVLFVSAAAMLVSQAALTRAGPPDGRLGFEEPELDFCWRIRLAGFHVVMTPLAVVRHRDAGRRGERRGDRSAEHHRYYQERGAGVAVSKNYGLGSVWVIPLYLLMGIVKLVALLLGRRFGEAGQILAAWGWNIIRFPGTIIRRVRIQAVRAVRDREIHRYMAHGSVRLRRWMDAAGRFLPGDIDLPEEDEGPQESFRERASTAARGHPVAAALVGGLVLAFLAYRPILSASHLTGGWLPSSLPDAGEFLRELGSGFRTTIAGGIQAASPALAAWGAPGQIPFVSTTFIEKLLLCGLPFASGISAYKLALRLTRHTLASLAAAACYSLSSLSLWSLSDGRIPLLMALAVLPKVLERIDVAFGTEAPSRRTRLIVGTSVFLALALAFLPGSILGVALMVLAYLLIPVRFRRLPGGLVLALGYVFAGTALVFPIAIDAVASGGGHLTSLVGSTDVSLISRLAIVDSIFSWPIAWFLPISAALALMLAAEEMRGSAWRLFLLASGGLFLVWASAAGRLPSTATNAGVYLTVAAVGCSGLVGIGVASALTMPRRFSLRWVTSLVLIGTVILGLSLQTVQAALGLWEIGPSEAPAAWPLVESGASAVERILWVGRDEGLPFPAPGGDPSHAVDIDGTRLRYALTDRGGVSMLDLGRPSWGPAYDYLNTALSEIVSGRGRHGGALLGPLGVRFIVAADGDLPEGLRRGIDRQVDLDQVPAGGLLIYRNASTWSTAALIQGEEMSGAIREGGLAEVVASQGAEESSPLVPVGGGWDGRGEGAAWIADQFAPGWVLTNGPATVRPHEALGWALAFGSAGGDVQVRYSQQGRHTVEMWLLAALWVLAMWFTRKPVRR